MSEIEQESVQIETELVWNAPYPKMQVRYRNLTKVYFRAVAIDWWQYATKRRWGWGGETVDNKSELLGKTPVFEWSADLPPTADYKERVELIPVPETLKPGFYFIVASHNPEFSGKRNQVSYTGVWVSELALVTRSTDGAVAGFVLDAASGEPIAGASIEARGRGWASGGEFTKEFKTATDSNGMFRIEVGNQSFHLIALLARHGERTLGAWQSCYSRSRQSERTTEQTIFFTDRVLYRPGQTIQYKGICLCVNREQDQYEVLPGRQLTVIFQDHNGKEVERQKHRTNDYGSFSGSFTAPRDRLTGRMTIRVEGEPQGAISFNVEEYKRPKFQVTLEAPTQAARVNDKVKVPGKALSYTGAAIDGAQVRYRVVREVCMPVWWWGWDGFRRSRGRIPWQHGEAQEIASGFTRTIADGSFAVEFVARPDLSVSPTNEPTFHFRVYADVTDSAGETRSAERTVIVGYTALAATIRVSQEPSAGAPDANKESEKSAEKAVAARALRVRPPRQPTGPEWLTSDADITLAIHTTTHDGVGQSAEGIVRIHKLKEPEKTPRANLGYEEGNNPADPNTWALGDVVWEKQFSTDNEGNQKLTLRLEPGTYRALLETQDRFKKKVTARLPLTVINPTATKLGLKVPHIFTAPKWTLEPGEEFVALWGTGYAVGRAYVEIEHRGKLLQNYWTRSDATQCLIRQPVTETMRGGFSIRVTYVRENRAYCENRFVTVPWSNKKLDLKWEHFTSKLEPGQKETWSLIVSGPQVERVTAELVATLYDRSLDGFFPHRWPRAFNCFRQESCGPSYVFANDGRFFNVIESTWERTYVDAPISYRTFLPELLGYFWGYRASDRVRRFGAVKELKEDGEMLAMNAAPATALRAAEKSGAAVMADAKNAVFGDDKAESQVMRKQRGAGGEEERPGAELAYVSPRKNLNETAFFFPHLLSDSNGVVKLTFTMPEALTEWRFFGFAHDAKLRAGFLSAELVTTRELMVQPNPPRFLREGDVLEFAVKVVNQSAARQTGKVMLNLFDARTGKPVDRDLGNSRPELTFDIPAQQSCSYAWRLKVPDGAGFLRYKAVASTGRLSDGEEGYLPILPRRILVTESLPLPIRGPATKKFEFSRLREAGKSTTLQHQSLTVQMVSNPSWYAVMALPYLMEFPYECSEQVFNRLYANALARFIALSDPKIARVFEQWKNTPALDSPLEKNQDLKSVMLEETPWVRDAEEESRARRNVGILFDNNRLNSELNRTLQKLSEMQLSDGLWPWFPGGRGNEYITLYITTGFGRLRHLGVDIQMEPALRSLQRLDAWIEEIYPEILKHGRPEENHLSPLIAFYLYGRSFFLKDKPIAPKPKEAVEYFLGQAKKYWLRLDNRQSKGHLALALKRFGDTQTATDIMKSIKEHAVTDDEMGMFWRDTELSWWWYRAPIETQALMIEALDEVMGDAKAVEDCKVWLLKQKQTQNWKTTKATADAVYALLLRGAHNLASDVLVELTMGREEIKPEKVEAGTGFYEKRFRIDEIKPALATVTVKKADEGVAWGSVHWQYLEDMQKVTPYAGTPLKLKKTLYKKALTKSGPVLEPVKGKLNVGDELVVRIELRTDRDMEYVHMKDQRGSGVEPVNVLSCYRFQDGLMYYESTRDTASHFFIDYLPKGIYVFEYSTRVQHRGQYQSGVASIECMYAPEFNSHSESFLITVE
ncbi:MAG: alpha-2-macroglobulin family protein [Kiritimatiellia bacterium]